MCDQNTIKNYYHLYYFLLKRSNNMDRYLNNKNTQIIHMGATPW